MSLLLDPLLFEEAANDYDDFNAYGRGRKQRYRGVAPRYRRPKFPLRTMGKSPESILLPIKKAKALQQAVQKKKTAAVSTPKKKPVKTVTPPQKPSSDTMKADVTKAMEADTRASTPSKIIAITVAVSFLAFGGYWFWQHRKKQIL